MTPEEQLKELQELYRQTQEDHMYLISTSSIVCLIFGAACGFLLCNYLGF